MSTLVRLLTLLTIAAAGFALPMTCAQAASAADPVAIEIPAAPQANSFAELPAESIGEDSASSLMQRLFEGTPLDCDNSPSSTATDQPVTFDTQPFVPGYLVSNFQLGEESSDSFAPPPVLIPIESRAGPPDAPPPKSID